MAKAMKTLALHYPVFYRFIILTSISCFVCSIFDNEDNNV